MRYLLTSLALISISATSLFGEPGFPVVKEATEVILDPAKPGYGKLMGKVTPAVVSVFPARLIEGSEDESPLDRFFKKPSDEDSEEEDDEADERVQGVGSGVIISKDGWILTNSHVVHLVNGALADAVKVELSDRRRFSACIVGADPLTDVALLKIEAAKVPCLPIGDSDKVIVGDLVFAVGNPFKIGMTATMGMISATHRSSINLNGPGGYESFIQTDASINPGNSGGALVDVYGNLVGINTAIYSRNRGNIGLGFAIPSRFAREIALRLKEDGKMIRGFFGVSVKEVTAEVAEEKKLSQISGALLEEIMAGSPAEKAGLKEGDVVVSANQKKVITREDFRIAMSFVKPGEKLSLEYDRDGKRMQTQMTAAVGVERFGDEQTEEFKMEVLEGVTFRFEQGVMTVTQVEKKSSYRKTLTAGMEIMAINGEKVFEVIDAEGALKKGVNKVEVKSKGRTRTLALRIK